MPIIPRLQTPGPLADAPAPVLDRHQRPTVDTSGAQRALLQFNEANKAPLMDPQALAAPYEALGSVGRAIAQAGDVVKAVAVKNEESKGIRQVGKFEVKYTETMAGVDEFVQANANNPEAWEPHLKEQFTTLRSGILADESLTSAARQKIETTLEIREAEALREVGLRATKTNFGLARESYRVAAGAHYQRGDRGAGDAKLSEAVSGGYMSQPEAQAEQIHGRVAASSLQLKQMDAESTRLVAAGDVAGARALWATAKAPDDITAPTFEIVRKQALTDIDYRHAVNQEMDALRQLGLTDPARGEQDLADPAKFPRITGYQRQEMIAHMKVARDAAAGDEVQKARRAIDMLTYEQLKNAKTEDLGVELKQATPWHRQVISQMIEDKKGKTGYEERFMALRATVAEWQSTGQEDQDRVVLARMEMAAQTLPAVYQKKITELIDKVSVSKTPPIAAAIAKATRDALDRSAFVALSGRAAAGTAPAGQTPDIVAGIYEGTESAPDAQRWVSREVTDPVAKAHSMEMVKKAVARLERDALLDKHKNWTAQDAMDHMDSIMISLGARIENEGQPRPALLPLPGWQPRDLSPEAVRETIQKYRQ